MEANIGDIIKAHGQQVQVIDISPNEYETEYILEHNIVVPDKRYTTNVIKESEIQEIIK